MAIIGREAFADIVLAFPKVSARHALIEALGSGRFRVTDVGSANGTYVDGRRVATAEIRTGSDLRLGPVEFDWNAHRSVLDAEAALPPGMFLGRDASCDFVVPDNRVSGRHLRVIPQATGLLIMDLGSANGVTVNDRPVARAVVQPSDKVCLGSLTLNLFSLVASRSARPAAAPPPAPPPPAWSVAPPPVSPSPAPAEVRPAPGRKGGAPWVWGIAAALVLGAAGVGLLFATREEVVKACELGPEEVFHEKVFFYQAAEARARAQAIRWCPRHANEPVTVTRRRMCEVCKKEIDRGPVQVPRRENPHDFEVYEGICSDACRMDKLARDAASGAATVLTDIAGKLLE
jgi:pSer/pThr/pTyr-binding forkhead associated (FHA) protein